MYNKHNLLYVRYFKMVNSNSVGVCTVGIVDIVCVELNATMSKSTTVKFRIW